MTRESELGSLSELRRPDQTTKPKYAGGASEA